MKYAIRHLVLIGLLLVVACNGNEQAVQDFSSEAGAFSITTPSAFEETEDSVETPVGPIDIHTFTAEKDNAAYVVAYSDYPAEMVAQVDPQALLDSSRDGALQNLGGTLVSEEVITLEGNPGRSLVITATDPTGGESTINSRIYLVDNRLYQIVVVNPEGTEKTTDPAKFLDSFDLTLD